jgi:ubiquitin-conjugating enzyme E2 A
MKDYKELQSDKSLDGISAAPDSSNTLVWKGVICGPLDTHWEGGVFTISLTFAHDYPASPPSVKFITQIYHPNGTPNLEEPVQDTHSPNRLSDSQLGFITVYADGSLCLDILQKNWSSAYTVGAILTSIQSLLPDPNPASPANAEAAKLFVDNKKEYYKRVLESVEASWTHVDVQ